ncbi:hypothetical protein [Kitasatospora sp. NBC_00315]|uniref:hypothetical protein n=1 Tax=Kitasatospora sp. NBC_00315 TaxID=2975963 RepID=UPI00324A7B57
MLIGVLGEEHLLTRHAQGARGLQTAVGQAGQRVGGHPLTAGDAGLARGWRRPGELTAYQLDRLRSRGAAQGGVAVLGGIRVDLRLRR